MNTSDGSAMFNTIIKEAENRAYDKILNHSEEVKRLITVEYYNNCDRLGHSAEVFRNMGYIEALKYIEEYIKNLKEEQK